MDDLMKFKRSLLSLSLSLMMPAIFLTPSLAHAHGHISKPLARHLMCKNQGASTEGCAEYKRQGSPGIYEAGGHTGKGWRNYFNQTPDGQICSTNYGAPNKGINATLSKGD